MRGYAYHEVFGLHVGLAFRGFCSALAATLEKKEAGFLKTEK